MAIEWDKILDVPAGTVLTDETIDAFILAFEQSGIAKQRGTSGGTYPSETPWTASNYSIPEGVSFGTKRIPGANPFYFVNKEDEQGQIFPEFGVIEQYDPSETYRFVEYLKSTGTQRIDTDIIPSYTSKIELDAKFGSQVNVGVGSASPIGVGQNDANNNPYSRFTVSFEPGLSGNYDYFAYYIGFPWTSTMTQNHVIADVGYTNRNTIILQRDTCSYGNKSCTLTIPISLSAPTEGICIFGNHGVNRTAFGLRDMYVYGVKVYNSNTITNELVPAERKVDGVLGLYDMVTRNFYTNAGAGTFEKGSYVD